MWRIFWREELGAKAGLALARRQDHVTKVSLEPGDRGAGGLRGGLEAGRDRRDGRVVGVGLGLAERVVDQRPDARQLLERGLGLEPPDGPAVDPDQRRTGTIEDLGEALQPARHRREPVAQRRELAGEQVEQAATDDIDPLERVPGILAQLALGELDGRDLAEDQVAVDGLVGTQAAQGLECRLPAIHGRQSLDAAGLGGIGPQAVEAVVADRRCRHRVEPEQVIEERPEDIVERGHWFQTPIASRSSRKSQPRVSPGSMRTTTPSWLSE